VGWVAWVLRLGPLVSWTEPKPWSNILISFWKIALLQSMYNGGVKKWKSKGHIACDPTVRFGVGSAQWQSVGEGRVVQH
jgi:hypothetical protein